MHLYIYDCQKCGGRIMFGITRGTAIKYAMQRISMKEAIKNEVERFEEDNKKHPPSGKIIYLEIAPTVCPHCGWKPPEKEYFRLVSHYS